MAADLNTRHHGHMRFHRQYTISNLIIYIYMYYDYIWLYMYICINIIKYMYVYCIHACIKKKHSIYVIIHVAICWRMDWDQTVNNGPSKNGTGTRMDLYRWVGVSGHNRSWLCRPPPLVRLPLGHGNLSSTDRTKDTTCGDFPSHGIPSRCFQWSLDDLKVRF